MNKFWNLINIVLIIWLAYAIITDNVSQDLKLAAWVLWGVIVVLSICKFHLSCNKKAKSND